MVRRLLKLLGLGVGLGLLAACTTTPPDYVPPPPPPPKPGQVIKAPQRVTPSFDVRTYAADDYDVFMLVRNAPSVQAAIQLSEMRAAELCLEGGYRFYKPTQQGLVRGQSGMAHVRVKCFKVYVDHQNMKTAANTIRMVRRAYGLG